MITGTSLAYHHPTRVVFAKVPKIPPILRFHLDKPRHVLLSNLLWRVATFVSPRRSAITLRLASTSSGRDITCIWSRFRIVRPRHYLTSRLASSSSGRDIVCISSRRIATSLFFSSRRTQVPPSPMSHLPCLASPPYLSSLKVTASYFHSTSPNPRHRNTLLWRTR
jgi:hypothetical protein